jgi:WD repeat-containing protein 92
MDSTAAPQIIEIANRSLTFTPFDVKWIPSSCKFALVGQTPSAKGIFQIFQLDQQVEGKMKLIHEFVKGSGYKCTTFGASSLTPRSIAMGDFSGNLSILDLETLKESYSVKAHEGIINTIDGAGGSGFGPPEIVTGGRDGCVRVWDPRQTSPVVSLEAAETIKPDCWAVSFGNCYNDQERVLSAGYDNGDIKLFDLRTNYLQWDHNLANAICGLQFDRRDAMMNKLVAATLEGKFYVFDLRTFNANEGGYSGMFEKVHGATLWSVKHVPQNRDLFVTQGGNGSINLYKYNYPSQRQVQDLNGQPKGVPGTVTQLNQKDLSTQPVNSFDWNSDKLGLAVITALDQTLKVIITTKLNTF